MADATLTASQILVIIDKCHKKGVKTFKFNGLELQFDEKVEKIEQKIEFSEENQLKEVEIEKKASPRDEFYRVLEEAKYLDPLLFEKMSEIDPPTAEGGPN